MRKTCTTQSKIKLSTAVCVFCPNLAAHQAQFKDGISFLVVAVLRMADFVTTTFTSWTTFPSSVTICAFFLGYKASYRSIQCLDTPGLYLQELSFGASTWGSHATYFIAKISQLIISVPRFSGILLCTLKYFAVGCPGIFLLSVPSTAL